MIRITLISVLLTLLSTNGDAQTVFATETFQTSAAPQGTLAAGYVGDMGTWAVTNTGVNNGSANNWYVSGEECGNAAGSCGTACSGGDASLHISAIGGLCGGTPDCGAAYDATNATNITNQRAESPTVDCSGNFFIELNFNYIAAQGDDTFWVEYSTDNGTNWFTFVGGNLTESGCCCLAPGFCTNPADPTPCSDFFSVQGYWTAVNLSFPMAANNNPNVKFAFHWSNDGNGLGTDPSVAIDDITLTYATMLPVDMLNFEGHSANNISELTWTTASEFNTSHHIIEYSADGQFFREVGRLDAQGDKSSLTNYSFLHQSEMEMNYYRIQSVDKDGTRAYSEVISVQNDQDEIYLSRMMNTYTIKGLADKNGTIAVYNIEGRQVLQPIEFRKEMGEHQLDLTEMKSGVYIISVISNNGSKKFKVIKE